MAQKTYRIKIIMYADYNESILKFVLKKKQCFIPKHGGSTALSLTTCGGCSQRPFYAFKGFDRTVFADSDICDFICKKNIIF